MPGRWVEAMLLLLFLAALVSGWHPAVSAGVTRVAKDVHLRPLGPAIQTAGGALQAQALICTGTVGQSIRPVVTRAGDPEGGRIGVFAAGPVHSRHTLFGDCRTPTACRVHVIGSSIRPQASYRLAALAPAPRIADGWEVCAAGALDRLPALQAIRSPPVIWRALTEPSLLRSTSFVLAPLWLGGGLLIVFWRLDRLPPMARALAMAAVGAAMIAWAAHNALIAMMAGLVVVLEIAALASALVYVCTWRLSAPVLRVAATRPAAA